LEDFNVEKTEKQSSVASEIHAGLASCFRKWIVRDPDPGPIAQIALHDGDEKDGKDSAAAAIPFIRRNGTGRPCRKKV
jgi:hypothetical protein